MPTFLLRRERNDTIETTEFLKHGYINFTFRLILGSIFIYASLDKSLHPFSFAQSIYNYRILPDIAINIFAIIIPWIELICGLLLLTGFLIEGSILIINFLLVIFFFAMTIALYQGLDISCGCFSVENSFEKISFFYLIRDILMLGMGLYIFFTSK